MLKCLFGKNSILLFSNQTDMNACVGDLTTKCWEGCTGYRAHCDKINWVKYCEDEELEYTCSDDGLDFLEMRYGRYYS